MLVFFSRPLRLALVQTHSPPTLSMTTLSSTLSALPRRMQSCFPHPRTSVQTPSLLSRAMTTLALTLSALPRLMQSCFPHPRASAAQTPSLFPHAMMTLALTLISVPRRMLDSFSHPPPSANTPSCIPRARAIPTRTPSWNSRTR